MFINGDENWKTEYQKGGTRRRNIWIRVQFDNDDVVYIDDAKHWGDLDVAGRNIVSIGLKYRTHIVNIDTSDSEAVYVVKSLMAQFGGDTVHFITTGLLRDGVVYKTRWHVPALVEESKTEDSLDECFEEAIIYHGKTKDQ